jgi:hypothetical protein
MMSKPNFEPTIGHFLGLPEAHAQRAHNALFIYRDDNNGLWSARVAADVGSHPPAGLRADQSD